VQGYLISPPIPVGELEQLLRTPPYGVSKQHAALNALPVDAGP
jgi:hypothetical protein